MNIELAYTLADGFGIYVPEHGWECVCRKMLSLLTSLSSPSTSLSPSERTTLWKLPKCVPHVCCGAKVTVQPRRIPKSLQLWARTPEQNWSLVWESKTRSALMWCHLSRRWHLLRARTYTSHTCTNALAGYCLISRISLHMCICLGPPRGKKHIAEYEPWGQLLICGGLG